MIGHEIRDEGYLTLEDRLEGEARQARRAALRLAWLRGATCGLLFGATLAAWARGADWWAAGLGLWLVARLLLSWRAVR